MKGHALLVGNSEKLSEVGEREDGVGQSVRMTMVKSGGATLLSTQ